MQQPRVEREESLGGKTEQAEWPLIGPHAQLPTTTMTSAPPVFALIPTTQSYDWGKAGSDSEVARLATASKLPGFQLDEQARYAEVSHTYSPTARQVSGNLGFSYGWGHILIHLLMYFRLIQPFPNTWRLIPSLLVSVLLNTLKRQMATSHSYSKSCPLKRPSVSRRILTRTLQKNFMLSTLTSTKVCASSLYNSVRPVLTANPKTQITSRRWR